MRREEIEIFKKCFYKFTPSDNERMNAVTGEEVICEERIKQYEDGDMQNEANGGY